MRAHGLEKMIECGRRRRRRRDSLRVAPKLRLPEAFSMIDLNGEKEVSARPADASDIWNWTYRSMMEITGATNPAAQAAATASVPKRRPRFSVFHFLRTLCGISVSGLAGMGLVRSGASTPAYACLVDRGSKRRFYALQGRSRKRQRSSLPELLGEKNECNNAQKVPYKPSELQCMECLPLGAVC